MILNPLNENDTEQKYQSIKFGTGSILGKYVSDRICFGDDEIQEQCIENFGFIQATEMTSDPFEDLPFDGILGLGFLELSLNAQFNFLKQLTY